MFRYSFIGHAKRKRAKNEFLKRMENYCLFGDFLLVFLLSKKLLLKYKLVHA